MQSLALANKLADNISLFHCTIRQPWLSFAPRILPRFGRNIIWEKQQPNNSLPPDIIITCGRRMAAIGKYYKRLLKCKHLQILNPGDNPKKYDIVICPEHDGVRGKNVITTKGSIHGVSVNALAKIKCFDASETVSLIIGNPSKTFFKELDKITANINKYFPTYDLVICGSRRTPKKFHTKIRNSFKKARLIWFSEKEGENPYLKLLACSKVLIVTADSINMLSEACATNKQVIAIGQGQIPLKHKKFISSLGGRLSNFGDENINDKPLQIIDGIVRQVLQLI